MADMTGSMGEIRRRSVVGSMAMVAALVSGCGEVPWADPLTVSDSAGVRIAEVAWNQVPVRWEVDPDPEWVIGDEGAAEFGLPLFQVQDVEQLDDSLIAVAEGGTQEVVWIDLHDEEVRRFGGDGDGPAEFRGLRALFTRVDGQLGAFDAERNRIVMIDREVGLLHEESVHTYRSPGGAASVVTSGDGTRYLVNVAQAPADQWIEGWSRRTAPIIRLDPSPDTLVSMPGRETVMRSEPVIARAVLEFGATTLAGGANEGLWVGDTRDPQVGLWTSATGPRAIIRWRSDEEDLRRDRADALQAYVGRMDSPGRDIWEQLIPTIPDEEPLPAFHALLTGARGELWIGKHVPIDHSLRGDGAAVYEWLVVGEGFQDVGRLVTSAGFVPTRVGDGYLLGIHTDSLGIETVRRYNLRGGAS
jgi:hypothetical protein